MALINPTSPGTGQLAQVGYASPGYQVGLGNSYGQAQPFDLYVSPTSGSTITPLTSLLVVNAAGTIAALTVQFPSNAVNGQKLKIVSNQTITTLTTTAGTGSNGVADTINNSFSGAFTVSTTFGSSLAQQEWTYQLGAATNGTTALNTWYRTG